MLPTGYNKVECYPLICIAYIYTDDFSQSKDIGIDYCIKPYYYNELAYADYIGLLSPNVKGAQSMRDLFHEYHAIFNTLLQALKGQVPFMDKDQLKVENRHVFEPEWAE